MGSTIVCAVDIDDGEPPRALTVAADLAQRLDLPLVAAYVAPLVGPSAGHPLAGGEAIIGAPAPAIPYPVALPDSALAEIRDEARRHVEQLLAQWHVSAAQIAVALDATVADGLRRSATDHDAELLVIGSRGHGTVRAALLGSTSHALVADAPCPVVVVQHTD
ncbi:MAG: universal stress protein [Chloroflexi bacterium]|nr:universal stress protein [Chloroflexota bacterium]